jgi:hypothetical protein
VVIITTHYLRRSSHLDFNLEPTTVKRVWDWNTLSSSRWCLFNEKGWVDNGLFWQFWQCISKKIEKKFIYMSFYLWIDDHSNFIQFHYHLIVHQRSLNWNHCKLYKNLMVFDELSNDIEIAWNLNDHQSISRRTYL